MDLSRSGPFDLKAVLLYVVTDSIESTYECIELLLLLSESLLAGEDSRLTLALVLIFLVGGIFVPSIAPIS